MPELPDTSPTTHGPQRDVADLVLTGGRVIDPSTGFDQIADVATGNGTILAVGKDLTAVYPSARVVDATAMVVTPA